MAKMYYDNDADLSLIRAKKVAVIGYGSQGHAHALNLQRQRRRRARRPAGGQRVARQGRSRRPDGRRSVAEAAKWADVVMILTPDTTQPQLYRETIAPNLKPGKTLMFAHGFNIRFGTIVPPPDVDVVDGRAEVAGPPRPRAVRGRRRHAGADRHSPGCDRAGARARRCRTRRAIGVTRAGVIETTFAEETETDLFGEQAVLCGGVSALVKAGFETLVEAGYQPEIAYFECLHELKLIVDLMYRGGLNYMRYSVSDTAEHGDYTGGPRIVTEETRQTMKQMLDEIRSGRYAKRWIAENEKGRPRCSETRRAGSRRIRSSRSARGCAR